MVFEFLKRKKDNKDNFWKKCVEENIGGASLTINLESDDDIEFTSLNGQKEFRIPFVDITNNYQNEAFLRDILKNDGDLHRRTAALILIKGLPKYEDKPVIDLLSDLCEELGIGPLDYIKLIKDIEALNEATSGAKFYID